MSYMYPSYPSESEFTSLTYDMRLKDQQNKRKQKTSKSRSNRFQQVGTVMLNHQHLSKQQEIEMNKQPETYEDVLKETLHLEACANIQSMIHSNNQAIEKLEKTNLMLYQHLQNLKTIFRLKKSDQKISETNHQHQTYQTNDFNSDKLTQDPEISKEECNVKTEQKSSRRIYLPSKGPVRYTKESWVTEQYYVQEFLQSFLKDNILVTPSQPFNIIEKRKILELYLKWKNLRRLGKNQLAPFKVQQIITNEMKVVFGCTITMKEYVGLLFRDIHEPTETTETKDQNFQKKTEQTQTLKNKQKEKKDGNLNTVLIERQERIQEQFSIGSSDGQFKIEDHSFLLS